MAGADGRETFVSGGFVMGGLHAASGGPALTELERDVLDRLASAWNAFAELDRRAESDNAEFAAAIHRAQNLIALRVARRVDPDVWRQP